MRRRVAGTEARKLALEFEGGIGHLRPAAERVAVLHFLRAPAFDLGESRVVAGKNLAEIGDVIERVLFDQRGRLHGAQHLRVDFRRVEFRPIDAVERPMSAQSCRSKLKGRPQKPPSTPKEQTLAKNPGPAYGPG